MHQILKRLESIKTSIDSEDSESIFLQLTKLKEISDDIPLANIIKHLENNDYLLARIEIDKYIKIKTFFFNAKQQFSGSINNKMTNNIESKKRTSFMDDLFSGISSAVSAFNNGMRIFNTELEKARYELMEEAIQKGIELDKRMKDSALMHKLKASELEQAIFPAQQAQPIPVAQGQIDSKIFLTKKELLPNTLKDLSENNQNLNTKKPIELQEQLEINELSNLKSELKSLETEFQNLLVQKIEYLNDIEEFNHEYNLRLGEIIKSILNFKKEILYKQTIKYQELTTQEEELDKIIQTRHDDGVFKEYEDAKTDYDEFDEVYAHFKESQKEIINLNEQDRAQLKQLYKEAVRLCHTNILTDEQKQQMTDMMQMLKAADNKQDLDRIKQIFSSLKTISMLYSNVTCNDKAILREKINEHKENIAHIELEIKEFLQDDIYKTFAALENRDEYFEERKQQLLEEKERLEAEDRALFEGKEENSLEVANNVDEVAPEWMQILWDWSDKNNLPTGKILRKKENLPSLTVLDLTGQKLNYVPDEIINLKNLTEISLWDCGLRYLPKNIIELQSLKKLNIRTNPALMLTKAQEKWLMDLTNMNCIVYKDATVSIDDILFGEIKQKSEQLTEAVSYSYDELCKIVLDWIDAQFLSVYKYDLSKNYRAYVRGQDIAKQVVRDLQSGRTSKIELKYLVNNADFIVENVTYGTFGIENVGCMHKAKEESLKTKSTASKPTHKKIEAEFSPYASHIKSIEIPNFEKIRRYCNNLVDENKADEMQKYLAESGKMYKAIIYDALEQFIAHLDGKEITLMDWGCGQGLASMLVLDYIREKQLDIKVSQVILIDDDVIALRHAMVHVNTLSFDEMVMFALKSDDIETINCPQTIQNSITLNLFANDKMPVDWVVIENNNLSQAYFMCVSNKDSKFIDELYENLGDCLDLEIVSNRDGKIGKFQRFERIFKYNCIG
jgi:Leucine-rich repeat (LRR) protein